MKRVVVLVAGGLLVLNGTVAAPREGAALPADYRPGELLVKFRPEKAGSGKAVLGRYGAASARRFVHTEIEHWRLPEGVSVEETVAALRASGAVEFAEPNYRRYRRFEPDDGSFEQQWALNNTGQPITDYVTVRGTPGADMKLPKAWDVQADASSVVLAVIDESIEIAHPDLAANMMPGWDFAGNDADPSADNTYEGHGTAVTGCAGAAWNNGTGIAGVAPQVRIMPLKFALDVATELAAIDYAIANGAHIVNASWGGPMFSEAESSAVDALDANDILLVVAAGNSAIDNDLIPDYPSSLPNPNVIAVGASTVNDGLTSWTQFGQTTVDLVAPGEHVYTTMAPISSATFGNSGTPGLQYDYTQGTSFSAPYVAGIAALLKAHAPDATAPALRGRLLAGVAPLAATGATATDGRADAYAALTATPAPVILVAGFRVVDGATGNGRLDPGESAQLEVTLENAWEDAASVTATLTTTDPLVTVTQASADYGALAGLGAAPTARTFGIRLAPEGIGHRRILFQLTIGVGGVDGAPATVTRHFAVETGLLQLGVVQSERLQQNPRDTMQLFHVQVPAGTDRLRVWIDSDSDIDLAVRAGEVPQYHPCYRDGWAACVGPDTLVSADSDGEEYVIVDGPTAGTYYVLVTNHSGKANVNYTVIADRGSSGGSGALPPAALWSLALVLMGRGRRLVVALLIAAGLLSVMGCQSHAIAQAPGTTWLVTFESGTERESARRSLAAEGAQILREYGFEPIFQVSVPSQTVAKLRRLPGVVAVEENMGREIRGAGRGEDP